MNSLLSLKENMFLKIKDRKFTSIYRCLQIENIEVDGYQLSSRYHLQSEKSYEKVILEVKKDQKNSISISLYNLIEKVDFNIPLLSSLGSETIIYKNIENHQIETKYQIIKTNKQKERFFRYIISKDDHQYMDYQEHYTKDSFGNSYSIFKKISPSKIISNKRVDLFWEYKNILNSKLHIEVIKSKKSIMFYQSITLRRDHIQIINENYPIAKDYENYDDLKNKYHTYFQ